MDSDTIRLVARNRLDLAAYDAAVMGSEAGLPYAESWFLDALTKENWCALVQGEYHAVLPVPLKRSPRHLFRKIIAQPILCQQLGVYGAEKADSADYIGMCKEIYRLRPLAYSFNFTDNPAPVPADLKLKKMPNYVLPLHKTHAELSAAYSGNHRRNIRKAQKKGLAFEISRSPAAGSDLMELKRPLLSRRMRRNFKKPAQRLMRAALLRDRGFFARATLEGKLLSTVFVAMTDSSLVYLIAANHPGGRSTGASHFLVDEIVKKWAGSKLTLDFEGSVVPGVARFFSMFGSVDQPYYHLYQ